MKSGIINLWWLKGKVSLGTGRLCLFTFLQEGEDGYGEKVAKVNEDVPTGWVWPWFEYGRDSYRAFVNGK